MRILMIEAKSALPN